MKRSVPDSDRRSRSLLLHCIDGGVPYLTPSLLERYFPPSDDLFLGIAVRDTCVVPTFKDDSKAKSKKKATSIKKNKIQPAGHQVQHNNSNIDESPKPRGYSFNPVKPDRWLTPYTRVTVPSFSLVNDELTCQRGKPRQPQPKDKGNDNHVRVWTPHGKQNLTVDLYSASCTGLESNFSVSLYDMSNENNDKRQEKAILRNQQWFVEFLRRQKEGVVAGRAVSTTWAPVIIPSAADIPPEKVQLSLAHVEGVDANEVSGVALVGSWRKEYDEQLRSLGVPHVALLSADSLSEVLESCCSAFISVIGTDLPTRWAKEKKALVVDISWRNKRIRPNNTSSMSEGVAQRFPKLDVDGCIDLHDIKLRRDSKPLVMGCDCLACNGDKFSRAYLHHLVCAKELVAEILLFAHNLHHLLQLIRSFSEQEGPNDLRDFINSQITQ